MTRNADERRSLIESLPTDENATPEWVLAFAQRLGRGPDCPPLGELLSLQSGTLLPERVEAIQKHLGEGKGCRYCGMWAAGLGRTWDPADAAREFQAQAAKAAPAPAPTPPPAPAVRPPAAKAAAAPRPGRDEAERSWSQMTGVVTRYRRGDKHRALAEVRPNLPIYLRGVGLAPTLAGRLEAYLETHAGDVRDDEPVLTQWLRNFARDELKLELPHEPTADEWLRYLERAFVRQLLQKGLPTGKESESQKAFREEALRTSRAHTVTGLRSFVPAGSAETVSVRTYRDALANEAERQLGVSKSSVGRAR